MKLFTFFLLNLTLCCAFAQAPQGSVVAQHGRLQVSGSYVANQYNQKISLAGNSLFWSLDEAHGGKFFNAETLNHLADNWNSSIIRVAMGVDAFGGGYLVNPVSEMNKVKAVVDAAIDKGIYVIIDWHSHHANLQQAEAITFFKEIATLYGSYDNVIYEIYNEPNYKWKVSDSEKTERNEISWPEIKIYAEAVITAIRSIDTDNLIIVGTPHWSGGHLVGKPGTYADGTPRVHAIGPADDPITMDNNVAYTLHFYANSNYHNNNFKDDAKAAMDKGIPIFVTEWGTVDENGQGDVNYYQTDLWMNFLKENYISHANWAISDKNEGASAIKPSAGIQGLKNDNLTNSGRKVKEIIEQWNVTPANIVQNPSGGQTSKFEAENAELLGVSVSNTGYNNISNSAYVTEIIDDGDKIIFNNIIAPTSGVYPLTIRYACTSRKENYVRVNNGERENISFETATAFANKTIDVNLNAGNNTIAIEKHWGWFDVDYIKIDRLGNEEEPENPQPNTTLKFEAEDGQLTGVDVSNDATASNGQFVDGIDNDGDKIVVHADIENPGTYQLTIGYRSSSGNKNNDVYLNNTFLGNIQFVESNSFTELTVGEYYFESGQSTLEFVKSWGWMDVDYFKLIATQDQSGNSTNNICTRTIQVSYDTTADYYVAGTIESDAKILEDNAAEFIGIHQINLNDEFTVEKGGRFSATIDECPE